MKANNSKLGRLYSQPLHRFLIIVTICGVLLGLWWIVDDWFALQFVGSDATTTREAGASTAALIVLGLLGWNAWGNMRRRKFWLLSLGLLIMLAVIVAALYFVIILETFRNFSLSG